MLEELVVFAIVLFAVLFVVRRLTGYVPRGKKKKAHGPDVPVSRLVRKKDEKR